MTNHNQYCLDKTKASKSSFYFSFRFLSPSQKQAVTAVYAFCREVDDIVDECTDPKIAKTKIMWWQQEVENIFSGKPQHPISIAISEARSHHKIEKQHLLDMIDGMIMDLKYDSYSTTEDLEKYCYCVASSVGLMLTNIFGYKDSNTLIYAKKLGIAIQLINIMRDIGEDARRARVYIPEEDLYKFGITRDEIINLIDDQDERFQKLMEFEHDKARRIYNEAFHFLPNADRANQMPGIIMSKIYSCLLDEIKKAKFPVISHRVSLTPIRKIWIAWRTYRKEKSIEKINKNVITANG